MNAARFHEITQRYAAQRVAVIGDFCLDRYLEIDPARAEVSIETGLVVHNVVNVRSQPGAAGTIVNNLVALGVHEISVVGFCGDDGEGFELQRALSAMRGLRLDHFIPTSSRRTFTYCKPLVLESGKTPRELNRLDSKNWTPTPAALRERLSDSVRQLASRVDAIILMDQVDVPETGVVTPELLRVIGEIAQQNPGLLMIADSRRSLRGYPPVCLKMNAVELSALIESHQTLTIEQVKTAAGKLASSHRRSVFITMAEQGIIGASAEGVVGHAPSLPVLGEIDVVGAGDSVTANLAAALASKATLQESLELAMAAASVVVHQLGTTGTANVEQIMRKVAVTPLA